MELYAEVAQRRAARAARRERERAREERVRRRLAPVLRVAKMLFWAVAIYVLLFMGCLWASS